MNTCSDCGKRPVMVGHHSDICGACNDAYEKADREVDRCRDDILVYGYDRMAWVSDDGWD